MSIGSSRPFISICIPAYKHWDYVERLLTSLLAQTFTDFEVIITDDSPDESVGNLVTKYRSRLNLHYFKNTPALGTPENWNEAMRQAKGHWIKLIHDDDWLASDSSLQDYVDAINQNPKTDFFFSAYYNVKVNDGEGPDVIKEAKADKITGEASEKRKHSPTDNGNHSTADEKKEITSGASTEITAEERREITAEERREINAEERNEKGIPMQIHIPRNINGRTEMIKPELFRIKQLQQNPLTLLSKNIIGPPSVVIHRNNQKYFYDKNFKWLVDMDFYMRYLDNRIAVYIDKPLVNIGLNDQQVTRSSSLVREVEIPEHFKILEKTGIQQLNSLLVYDAWWRLIRNLKIRDLNEIKEAGYHGNIPKPIINLIKFQQKLPFSLLKFGPASKSLMLASYTHNKLTNRFKN